MSAPLGIGAAVRITGETWDDDCLFPRRLIGRVGRVVDMTRRRGWLGLMGTVEFNVGDTPENPAVIVAFGPAYGQAAQRDLFWPEEVEVLP